MEAGCAGSDGVSAEGYLVRVPRSGGGRATEVILLPLMATSGHACRPCMPTRTASAGGAQSVPRGCCCALCNGTVVLSGRVRALLHAWLAWPSAVRCPRVRTHALCRSGHTTRAGRWRCPCRRSAEAAQRCGWKWLACLRGVPRYCYPVPGRGVAAEADKALKRRRRPRRPFGASCGGLPGRPAPRRRRL